MQCLKSQKEIQALKVYKKCQWAIILPKEPTGELSDELLSKAEIVPDVYENTIWVPSIF